MFKFNFYHTRKENFFHNENKEETKGLIGHMRGDFDTHGKGFYHTWFDDNPKLKSPEFMMEFNDVVNFLRERLLTDRAYMRSFVKGHPEMKIESEITTSHGMFVDSENYEYDIRTISEDGNYDFYIYCYDKRLQKPQYLNKRRFRDEHGKLIDKLPEIAKQTLSEGRNYFIDGDRYEHNKKIYTFRNTENVMCFIGNDGETITVEPKNLGTYLPDVASSGMGFVKVSTNHILINLTLGDLLKGMSLSSVHLVHDEVDTDVATIETLTDAMLTDEGRKEWADILKSRVTELFNGYYGTQITCSNVDHERLTEFSYALAGNCPSEDYDKWFDFEEELKADMNMQEGQ